MKTIIQIFDEVCAEKIEKMNAKDNGEKRDFLTKKITSLREKIAENDLLIRLSLKLSDFHKVVEKEAEKFNCGNLCETCPRKEGCELRKIPNFQKATTEMLSVLAIYELLESFQETITKFNSQFVIGKEK